MGVMRWTPTEQSMFDSGYNGLGTLVQVSLLPPAAAAAVVGKSGPQLSGPRVVTVPLTAAGTVPQQGPVVQPVLARLGNRRTYRKTYRKKELRDNLARQSLSRFEYYYTILYSLTGHGPTLCWLQSSGR